MHRMLATVLIGFWTCGVQADVPRVVVDIPPVHSIVAAVMGTLGSPDLIVPPGSSPHDHQLRPSEARALQGADFFVWIGPELTPWLLAPTETLAGDAEVLALMGVPETVRLEIRSGAAFGDHDHDHGHDDHDDHADADLDTLHSDIDPHLWLDPQNAALWAGAVAGVLAIQDPENARIYSDNAARFASDMIALETDINAQLAPVRGRPFVVFHDAYHYFEHRFDIEALGAVTANDATAPSPARLSELQEAVAATGAVCALTEPQFNPGLLTALGDVKLGEIDPLGASLAPGPTLYPDMLRNMAASLVACLQ